MISEKKYLSTFFFLLFLFSVIKLTDNAINLDAWEYGEWLINYQEGFIRRGLIGELIFNFSNLFKINIQFSFIIVLTFLSAFYLYKCYLLFQKVKINFISIFVIFSPIFLLFFLIVNGVGIRKEIIFYIYYLNFLIDLHNKNFKKKFYDYYLFLFPLLLLIHESFFFYLPYLFLPLLFITPKKDKKILIKKFFLLSFLSILMILLLYNFRGTYEHTLTICDSLGSYAPIRCSEWGPTYALQHDLLRDQTNKDMNFFYLQANLKSWFGYLVYILYAFFPLFLYLKYGKFKSAIFNKKYFKFFLILIFVWSLPLFHVAEDWSRWFSMHYHLITFSLIFLNIINIHKFHFSKKINKLNNFLFKNKTIFILMVLIYTTLLSHEEYFSKDVELQITLLKLIQ